MKILFIGWLLICQNVVFAQTGIEGRWNTGKENTIIQIAKANGSWEGRTASSDDERVKPDLLVIRNLKQKDDHWVGEFYIFRIKKWADITLTPKEDRLDVEVWYGLLSKQLSWRSG